MYLRLKGGNRQYGGMHLFTTVNVDNARPDWELKSGVKDVPVHARQIVSAMNQKRISRMSAVDRSQSTFCLHAASGISHFKCYQKGQNAALHLECDAYI